MEFASSLCLNMILSSDRQCFWFCCGWGQALVCFVLYLVYPRLLGYPDSVLGCPNSAMYGLHLTKWYLSQIKHQLVTPTRFVPPLLQNNLQTGHIVDQLFWGWGWFLTCRVPFSVLVGKCFSVHSFHICLCLQRRRIQRVLFDNTYSPTAFAIYRIQTM